MYQQLFGGWAPPGGRTRCWEANTALPRPIAALKGRLLEQAGEGNAEENLAATIFLKVGASGDVDCWSVIL